MTINYTTLLGLAQPVTGTETGQWGDVVNDEITSLLEDAVANAATFSVTSGNVTLTTTNGASNQARMSTLIITGTPGTTRNVVAPSQSKSYVVINQSDSAVVIKGSATTGVTVGAGQTAQVAWNGSDFVEIGNYVHGNFVVNGNLTVNGNTQLGNSTSDTLAVTALVNANLLFTDNTYDIGASGANRPRNLFLSNGATVGGALVVNGAVDFNATTDSTSPTSGAFVIDGGVGIAKSLFVGGNVTVTKSSAPSSLRLQSTSPYSFPGDYTLQAGGQSTPALTISDNTSTLERLTFLSDVTVFNENSGDVDFRIESDGNGNMFFVDAGANKVLIGTNTVSSNGTLQVNGDIGIAANSTVRQATNGDGAGYLKFFGTQFVAGNLNSDSYNYADGGYLASVTAGDSAILFDTGRLVNTDGRVRVVNTTSGNVQLRVGKGSSYALLADTNNNRVGINNSSPTVALDVTGSFLASGSVQSSSDLFVGGSATTSPVGLDRGVYLQSTTNNGIVGYSMYINEGSNNRRGSMFLNDSTGVFGFDTTASSGVPVYKFYRAGTEYFGVGDEVVVNEGSNDIDFRVESDTNANAIFVNAQYSNIGINTAVTTAATFYIKESGATGASSSTSVLAVEAPNGNKPATLVSGNSGDQGTASWITVVKYVPANSSNNKLIIPFQAQGNLNSCTVCRVVGVSAQYNYNTPAGFEVTFQVGHLNALYNLGAWGGGGTYSSIAVNGMNVEITLSYNYNVLYGVSGGMFVTLEYLCNVPSYSIVPNGIALN